MTHQLDTACSLSMELKCVNCFYLLCLMIKRDCSYGKFVCL